MRNHIVQRPHGYTTCGEDLNKTHTGILLYCILVKLVESRFFKPEVQKCTIKLTLEIDIVAQFATRRLYNLFV